MWKSLHKELKSGLFSKSTYACDFTKTLPCTSWAQRGWAEGSQQTHINSTRHRAPAEQQLQHGGCPQLKANIRSSNKNVQAQVELQELF